MSSATPEVFDNFDSEYAVHILKTISENDDLREIKLVAELDEQKYFFHFI